MNHSPSSISLPSLPDELLQQILNRCCQLDVEHTKRVCKQMRHFVHNHRHRLPRTNVDSVSVRLRRLEPNHVLGRLRKPGYSKVGKTRLEVDIRRFGNKPSCSKTVQSEEFDEGDESLQVLDETLRELQINRELAFQGMQIDDGWYAQLVKPMVDLSNVNTLAFTACHFDLTSQQLVEVLRRTACTRLSLEFCAIDGATINDQVLGTMTTCEYLDVKLRHARTFPALTDRTLLNWARQSSLPRFINLAGAATEFSLSGVMAMLKAYRTRSSIVPATPVEWDFGRIQLPIDEDAPGQLIALFSLPDFTAKCNAGNPNSHIDAETITIELSSNGAGWMHIEQPKLPQMLLKLQLVKNAAKL